MRVIAMMKPTIQEMVGMAMAAGEIAGAGRRALALDGTVAGEVCEASALFS
jgi:hypothetical protein